MQGRGFDRDVLPKYVETDIDRRSFFETNFGISIHGQGRIDGYFVSDAGNEDFFEEPPSNAAEEAALTGTDDETGCAEAGIVELFGSLDASASYDNARFEIQELMVAIRSDFYASKLYADLNQQWSECMQAQGYAYGSPVDPWIAQWPEPRPGPEELAVAAADLTCQTEVGYEAAVTADLAQREEAVYEENFEMISRFVEAQDAVLRRAAQVAGEPVD